ncbi:MAG: hypothetical protein PHI91_02055 [Candidatus Pacebacteria bacterium]|nr:hypothetical protein [Candidatus Paceibacterota bacterium]MDD4737716.1 hypothetical protein [Candidatus Paceibacterota bacterium]
MEKLLEKLNKLSLPVVILIVIPVLGGFIFVTQIIKQQSIERQQEIKIENDKQEQLTKELKEQQAKEEAEQALNTCISNAEENYSDRWHRECKEQGKLTSKCIDINELAFDEYLKKYELTIEQYAKERNLTPTDPDVPASVHFSAILDYLRRAIIECSCRLSLSTADRFNESLEKAKVECFKRYPQK